jgi:hypothetical protein
MLKTAYWTHLRTVHVKAALVADHPAKWPTDDHVPNRDVGRHHAAHGVCTQIGKRPFRLVCGTTSSKSRLNFLDPLRAGHTDCVVNAEALAYMRGRGLIAEFDDLERRIIAHYPGGALYIEDDNERDEALEPLLSRQDALFERICATRAVTIEGLAARARSSQLWIADLLGTDETDMQRSDRMFFALLLDLTGSAVA